MGRPSNSSLERLGSFPVSTDSIALPRSSDARLPLLNVQTGTTSMLTTGSSFFRALSLHWHRDEPQGGWPTVNLLVNGQVILANYLVNSNVVGGFTRGRRGRPSGGPGKMVGA